MRHADFPVDEVDPEAEGPTFTLAGETFRCLPEMPAGAFLDLPDGLIAFSVAGRFIRACLVEEDEPKFDAVLASKSRVVGLKHLHPIFQYLIRAWNPEVPEDEGS